MFSLTRATKTILLAVAIGLPVAGMAGIDLISSTDATGALRQALEKGAGAAIGKLGQSGGFMNNPKVRIPLPKTLQKSEKMIRMLGKGDQLDQLKSSMNSAAEAAVPHAKDLMVKSVREMSVTDARKILSGGDDSVTKYFREKTSTALQGKFLPVVSKEVARLGVAKQYNTLAGQGSKLGLMKGDAASIETYVTARALDGLYTMIADEEKAIRANPLASGSKLLGKVFGALK